jgi:sugar phosphate isomerase/epimerase
MKQPLLILSSRASFNRHQECVDYSKKNDYQGIEWYLDHYRLPAGKKSREDFFAVLRNSALRHSFHGPTNDADIAQKDADHSRAACEYQMMYIDFLSELAPLTYTIHIGGRRMPLEELSWQHAMDNLKRVCAHGHSKGVTVCLENLVNGWVGDPEKLMEMVTASGAGITFDIGHARGGQWVREGQGTALEFLNIVAPKVVNAHVYEYENEKGEHLAPANTTEISPILARLLEIGCRWWVLELNAYAETENTRRIVNDHMNPRGGRA